MGKSVVSIILRGLAVVSFTVAAIIIFLSFQKIHQQSHAFVIRYLYWKGFTFNSTVNCIACLYHFIVLIIPPGSQLWKTVIVLDVVMSGAVSASLGTGWITLQMISEGNEHASWAPVCEGFPLFCGKILAALIASSFGFILALLLLVWTLHISVDPFLIRE